MRKTTLLTLCVLLSAPVLAWVPKLEETTARNVIDGAYARRDPVPTFQTVDLTVEGGKFKTADRLVGVFDGGEACLTDWLTAPLDYRKSSRPASITVSGQADQLYFQAQDARDNFKNLSVPDALNAENTAKRLQDGELRVDLLVRGLPSEKARSAYLVRLKGQEGKMIAPIRSNIVSDWKQDAGTWMGTLVYYFEPLKAGIGASDKTELLIRTEADNNCAYRVTLDLGSFQ